MLGLLSILSLSCDMFNKFNNTFISRYSKTGHKRPLITKTKIEFQDQLSLNAG